MDYIAELENEVFRLRNAEASLNSRLKDKDGQVTETRIAEAQGQLQNTITLHVLIQSLNGQLAPGLFITEEWLCDMGKRVRSPSLSNEEFGQHILEHTPCMLVLFC